MGLHDCSQGAGQALRHGQGDEIIEAPCFARISPCGIMSRDAFFLIAGSARTGRLRWSCGQLQPLHARHRCHRLLSRTHRSISSWIMLVTGSELCSITPAPGLLAGTGAQRVRFHLHTKFVTTTTTPVTLARAARGRQTAWSSATVLCTARLRRRVQQVKRCSHLLPHQRHGRLTVARQALAQRGHASEGQRRVCSGQQFC